MPGTVTVIIPVYNGEGFVGDAVASALAQTCKPWVIVVDDASSDNSVAVATAAGAGDPRLTVIAMPANGGPAKARNHAIFASDSEWIALLDADDRMAPDRLEKLVGRAQANRWDMAADDLWRVQDWDDIANARRHWRDADFGAIALDVGTFARENVYDYCGFGRELGFLKPVMRRQFLRDNAIAYDETLRLGEDFDLYARALIAGARFGLVDPLGYYALTRPGSMSKRQAANDQKKIHKATRALLYDPKLSADGRAGLVEHMQLHHRKWAWGRLIEAVHARDPIEAAMCFAAPPHVIFHLLARLREHFTDTTPRPKARQTRQA